MLDIEIFSRAELVALLSDLSQVPSCHTVYVLPPYCIGEDDLDRVYAAIGEAVEVF